ncbi:hypothetical protein D1224_01800 [Henriciella barbarensis]|uniref:META domain-containing protein n=1 Tax=Henriciella barbarensis TaxID=86342 RepID=A0A399R3L4_9PROT|nr:hypothetical protein [Henriciella barbarensis]RIJ25878.1 hypothetical protein D1224_01800 [Henriciella barbarensis]
MKLNLKLLAGCTAAIALAACGGPETVDETPAADDPIESEGSLTEDPEIGLDEEPGGDMDMTMSDTNMDAANETLAALEGDWVSGDDNLSKMSILDGTVTMMYDGEVLSTETLQTVDSCPDAPGDTSDMQLITMTGAESNETLCYGIIALTEAELQLTSYPRGNTLTYIRMPAVTESDME